MLSKLLIPIVLVFATLAGAGVELLSFRAIPMIDHGRLEWSSGEETSLDAFIVERSSDGQSFLAVTVAFALAAVEGSYPVSCVNRRKKTISRELERT